MSAILKFIRENHILALIEQAIVKKKSRLSLNAFEITEIPNLLYNCMDVENLYLHRNKITVIPVQITDLLNLTTLTLDYNNLSTLPPELGNLKNLVNLNISYNPLNVLIPEIGELENLEAFWCNRIGLREIPKEIGKLSKLDTFGARGNELTTIPEEMTKLAKLRWLTLENNQIETLPDGLDKMEALVHCNLRNNNLREFPMSILKCSDLMFLQINNNQISSLPEDFDTSFLTGLEMIDLRLNPICELSHPEHPLVRYAEELPSSEALQELSSQASSSRGHAQMAVNATQLRLPPPRHPPDPNVVGDDSLQLVVNGTQIRPQRHTPDPLLVEMDLDASSIESSEDWENSVNSSELDVQYQSDEDRADNEAIGMVLPELSRYASTAS
ncbi:leucine-rich repeat protein SHOC-2-like isoform X2 [Pectinophora gossypiella]|uniref:leucine-rich repeat protein SHOC-2-like isoform X2 n=1 Tax=Pectinophora gossypiella TaxID=13191 RepID=UPI00214E2BCE|nr:leucine-rich repeat protein SHOC-2-like isoform X2 [Pectinophora gossypiella]